MAAKRLSRLEHLGAHERHQRLGHPHTAVRSLVVLQNGDQPAGGGQGAVERRGDLRFAAGIAVTGGQSAGLEGGAVGRRDRSESIAGNLE